MFLEFSRYDATQLQVGTEDLLDDIPQHGCIGLGRERHLCRSQAMLPEAAPQNQPTAVGKSTQRSELMASEHEYAMLVQLDSGPSA